MSPLETRLTRRAFVAALAALPMAGCERRAPLGDDVKARMLREAEAELRRFGEGIFTVEAFNPGEHRDLTLIEYYHASKIHELRFEAMVRFTGEFRARAPNETAERVGKPGWTIDERDKDVVLFAIFGNWGRRAGEVMNVRASAMFDDLEPGYRFRLIDAWHPGTSRLTAGGDGAR
jgi:hypothetical protein